MAKFCGNCGAQMNDDARICGYCGELLDMIPNNSTWEKPKDPEKRKKAKRIVKTAIILLVVAALLASALSIVLNHTGARGLVRKTMSAYKNYNINKLILLSGDMYAYGSTTAQETYLKFAIGPRLDTIESSIGHNYKLSYKINDIYPVSERRFDEYIQTVENTYPDYNVSAIEKINIAEITLTAKQGKKTLNQNVELTLVKENGTWKLLYVN